MNSPRLAPLARTSACLALLLSLPALAQTGPKPMGGDFFAKGLPNLNPAVCRSDTSGASSNKCSSEVFKVVVNPLTMGGKTIGCAAFFFYRDLTIEMPRGGEATTVNWEISDVGTVSGAKAKFVDPAIRMSAKPGNGKPGPGDLFNTPTWTDTTAAVNVKKQRARKNIDHLPVVAYMDDNTPWTNCGGVDPTIGNNPS